MPIPVKLTRVKSRARARGRPRYKYVLRWQQNGKWQQESCHTSDRKAAEAMRKRKFAEVNGLVEDDGSAEPEPALTWDELEERTRAALESRGRAERTAENYLESIGMFRRLTDCPSPADVDAAGIESFIAERRKMEVSAASVNRDLRQLRAVFNRAVRREELTSNPFSNFERLTEVPKDLRILQPEEVREVIRFFARSPVLQTFMLVSLQTGGRIRELAYLLADDVDRATGWLMIRNKTLPDGREWRVKSKTSLRDLWLPPWLMVQLKAIRLRGKPFVWSRHLVEIGRAFEDEFDPEKFVGYVQHRIIECCEEIGLPRFSHHDLRRTQQTWLREHGWGDAVCLAVAGQNTGAKVLRDHYWRPNHRRMTQPAFEDAAGIFSASEVLEGDPLGDTCRLKPEFQAGTGAVSLVG